MTPEEFAHAMKALYPTGHISGYDPEAAHWKADDLLCMALRDLGYIEGVELFEAAERWYA